MTVDVKLGELLETPESSTRNSKTGNGMCDCKKDVLIGQSAAKLLSGNSGEGSTTTVSLKALAHGDDPTAPSSSTIELMI